MRRTIRVGMVLAALFGLGGAYVIAQVPAGSVGTGPPASSETAAAPQAATAQASPIPGQPVPGQPPANVGKAPQLDFATGFAPVATMVRPAVVRVRTVVRADSEPSPFEFFFGGGPNPPRERRGRGLGSGVLVSPEGVIVTNYHMVEDAERVRVTLSDGREFTAKVIGSDPPTELAVIKIDGKDLPYLRFGDSREVQVGEFAIAVGNPFGLGGSTTMGIISAVGRGDIGVADYEDFLQTDAAINPGNSGGALVNGRGELIGINTAIVSAGGGNQGVGFAVPSNMAREVMEQILARGKVVRGFLGVGIQELTPPLAAALGMGAQTGALVGDVSAGSPAEKAGLRRGDVVVSLDGTPVTSSAELRNRVAAIAPGTKVRLGIVRGKDRQEVTATLGELPSKGAAKPSGEKDEPEALGLRISPLTPEIQQRLDVPPGTRGVVVTGVASGSPASDAGLRPGDVVVEVDRKPVKTPQDLRAAVRADGTKPMLFLVLREGSTAYVLVER